GYETTLSFQNNQQFLILYPYLYPCSPPFRFFPYHRCKVPLHVMIPNEPVYI
ncbi:hypothetical protein BGX38DRAFT_1208489, partial [Terfezia claveryi]